MIEILFFDGCPNHEPTLALAREVVGELGVAAEIREVRVETEEELIASAIEAEIGEPLLNA